MNKTNKEKTLIIAGKEYPVTLGVNYFPRYFEEGTGIDLIKQGILSVTEVSNKAFLFLAGFIYAGHRANCSLYNKPCELSFEDADRMVMSMTEEETSKLFNECFALYLGMELHEYEKLLVKTTKEAEKNQTAQAGRKK